jgi:hypothetical protein
MKAGHALLALAAVAWRELTRFVNLWRPTGPTRSRSQTAANVLSYHRSSEWPRSVIPDMPKETTPIHLINA